MSRKLIHIGTGPLFVLSWPFFSDNSDARYWAALVPLIITLKFVGIGIGWIDDAAAVKSMTRHNDPREILKGPLFYGIVFIACTVLFWRTSPVGMLALMIMCGGDGFADIIGRRFGIHKLPLSGGKSWAGSAAMLVAGFSFGFSVLLLFNYLGYFESAFDWKIIAINVAVISFVATLVEALPFKDIDNLTLTTVSVVLAQILF